MPRTLNRKAPRRQSRATAKTGAEFDRRGTVDLDVGEKHEMVHDLILKHAAERARLPAENQWALRIGVLASCVMVFSGWWLTLNTNLNFRASADDHGIVQAVKDSYHRTVEKNGPFPLNNIGQDQNLKNTVQQVQIQVDKALIPKIMTVSSTAGASSSSL